MKVVICGGSGNVGTALVQHFRAKGDQVAVLSRKAGSGQVVWDGKTLGPWAEALDGADVVINLAGRSVNCRYNEANLREMMDSRVDSTRVVGQAIAKAKNPPKLWLQASAATIYAPQSATPSDEFNGVIDSESAPMTKARRATLAITKAWEQTLNEANTPNTRKVALRNSLVMGIEKGSVFDVLQTLARRGLGGRLGSGKQYISWIHESDYAKVVDFLIAREDLSGAINICAPNPMPQVDFARVIRKAVGAWFAPPAAGWMVKIGSWLIGTESELVMGSTHVVPARLLDAGFQFDHPDWQEACKDLIGRMSK